jgi:hypothetical protein
VAEDHQPAARTWLKELGNVLRAALSVPRQADRALARLERGEISVRIPDLTAQVARLELTLRRLLAGVLFTGLLLGGLQLDQSGHRAYARGLFAGAVLALAGCVFAGRRRGA